MKRPRILKKPYDERKMDRSLWSTVTGGNLQWAQTLYLQTFDWHSTRELPASLGGWLACTAPWLAWTARNEVSEKHLLSIATKTTQQIHGQRWKMENWWVAPFRSLNLSYSNQPKMHLHPSKPTCCLQGELFSLSKDEQQTGTSHDLL